MGERDGYHLSTESILVWKHPALVNFADVETRNTWWSLFREATCLFQFISCLHKVDAQQGEEQLGYATAQRWA